MRACYVHYVLGMLVMMLVTSLKYCISSALGEMIDVDEECIVVPSRYINETVGCAVRITASNAGFYSIEARTA